jgi:hypothetical protein
MVAALDDRRRFEIHFNLNFSLKKCLCNLKDFQGIFLICRRRDVSNFSTSSSRNRETFKGRNKNSCFSLKIEVRFKS